MTQARLIKIPFLQLIPIYAEERQWIMETDTFEGYMLLDGVFGYRVQYADSKREKYIPDSYVQSYESRANLPQDHTND